MPIAAGLFKQLIYKTETTYGVAPGQSAAQVLRRVTSTVDLSKESYAANEKRTDFQIADFRHGVRRVGGQITGELSPQTYGELFGITLKRDFTTVTAITGASITISGTGPTYTVARAAGSFLTDNIKVGDVVRLTAGSFNANNLNKNLLVTAVVALSLTVVVLNGSTMTAEGPIATATLSVPGRKTFVPTTGHTDKSFSIEHWFADVPASELFLGCKIGKASLSLPPTGLATVTFDVMGQDFADTTAKRGSVALTTQYFTSPTAITSSGTLAAVNGLLRIGGTTVATVTGLTIDITPAYTGDPVVGSNTIPQMFPGKLSVTGQFTAYFDDVTLRNAFVNETEIDLIAAFTVDNTANANFMTVVLPRIKVGSANKDDGDGGLVQTFSFQALLNSVGGTGVNTERTTIVMQDSLL